MYNKSYSNLLWRSVERTEHSNPWFLWPLPQREVTLLSWFKMKITMHSFVSMYSHRNFSINDLPCASQDSIDSTSLLGHTDITLCEKKLTAHRPFYLDWDSLNTNYDISVIRFWKKKKKTVSSHCLSVICKLKLPLLTSPSCLESKEIRQCVQKKSSSVTK